jgi:dimethyl sulfoxide reductase iron-sulfur subunit
MARLGIVIDLRKCQGCGTCEVACKFANNTPPGVSRIKVVKKELGKYPNVSELYQPVQCMHCAKAPCVEQCPTGASHREANGIVSVDSNKCIGCRTCEKACPYGARTYIDTVRSYFIDQKSPFDQAAAASHKIGVETSCNMCRDLVAAGQEPQCVARCPEFARFFGDLSDSQSAVSRLIALRHGEQLAVHLGTDPSIYYLPA